MDKGKQCTSRILQAWRFLVYSTRIAGVNAVWRLALICSHFAWCQKNASILKLSNPCISEQSTRFYFTYPMHNMKYIYTHTHTHTHIYIYIYMCVCVKTHTHKHIRGVSPTCFSTATTKLLQTEELVNCNSLVAIGFKTGHMFSLKIVHIYWNMSEIRLKYFHIVYIVYLVGEIKRSTLLKCEYCVEFCYYICWHIPVGEVMFVCRYL